jgi:hemolysin activation/secretion protein
MKHYSLPAQLLVTSFVVSSSLVAEVPTLGNTMQGIKPSVVPSSLSIGTANETLAEKSATENRTTVLVKKIRLVGNKGLSDKELLANVLSYENRELTLAQIDEIARKITETYRKKGYLSATAYVKEGGIPKSGVLTLIIKKKTNQSVSGQTVASASLSISDIGKPSMQNNIDENRSTVFVKKIKLENNQELSERDLSLSILPYENRELTFGQINEMMQKITETYRNHGYFMAASYVKKGGLDTDGTLTVTINRGTVGKVFLTNTSLVKDASIEAIMNNLLGSDYQTDSIQKAILLTNELSGAKISEISIVPGEEIGSGDLVVTTSPTPRTDGYVVTDNYGSVYTGRYRLSAGLNLNSPLGFGDKLSVMGMLTNGTGMKNGSVSYSFPMSGDGLTLSGGYSKSTYALDGSYADLNSIGTVSSTNMNATYPLVKNNTESLILSMGVQYQTIENEQLGDETDKKNKMGTIGIDYTNARSLFDLPSTIKVNAVYTFGKLQFDNEANAVYDHATTDTEGLWHKLSTSMTFAISPLQNWTFSNTLNGQFAFAHKNLDGSQQMLISGPYAARAFPITQESADSGYVYTAEL